MDAVSILTIKEKTPLYKDGDVANRVELINLNEVGFDIVAQKDLYSVGDRVVYIQPDYCLSDINLFESFIRPNGDESKSFLGKIEGKPRRIRAKKFNLHKGDYLTVYSNGILLPIEDVVVYIKQYKNDFDFSSINLTEFLGITKYEPVDSISNESHSFVAESFPLNVYKTDETNINNLWGHIEKLGYPIHLIGTQKIDGSSISIGITSDYPNGFIASRNRNIPIYIKKQIGVRKKTFKEFLYFWKNHDLNVYELVLNDSNDYIKYGMFYLNLLKDNQISNVILRGELNGSSLRGSGNKNNPSIKEKPNIKFFGIDGFDNGIAEKNTHKYFIDFCDEYKIPTVPVVFEKTFNNKEDIVKDCELYFKENSDKGVLIEGLVLKTTDSKFSAKYMNNEYDSKK